MKLKKSRAEAMSERDLVDHAATCIDAAIDTLGYTQRAGWQSELVALMDRIQADRRVELGK